MTTLAIIQARMTSTRYPGKVMADIAGHPMLWHVYQRVCRAELVDYVAVAMADENCQPLTDFCISEGIFITWGPTDDVLRRYYEAAHTPIIKADIIVRITSDCPLIDPAVIDAVAFPVFEGDAAYSSNVHPPTYPDGLDVEVFTRGALDLAEATTPAGHPDREHVTGPIRALVAASQQANITCPEGNLSLLRWTVDYPDDLAFIRHVYTRLGPDAGYQDILPLAQDWRDERRHRRNEK